MAKGKKPSGRKRSVLINAAKNLGLSSITFTSTRGKTISEESKILANSEPSPTQRRGSSGGRYIHLH